MEAGSLLRLLQVSDSAFPTGSFSHSMGLEAFHTAGELENADDLKRAVSMHLGSMSTSDCVALRGAYVQESLEGLVQIDQLLSATKLTRELRQASAATGRRFIASVTALGVKDRRLEGFARLAREGGSPGNLAVGYGVAAPVLEIGLGDTLHAYLYATTSSLVAVGQKLIPLGGSAAQRVLFQLEGEILAAARRSEGLEAEEMHAFAPLLDDRSMLHERQSTRLYIS